MVVRLAGYREAQAVGDPRVRAGVDVLIEIPGQAARLVFDPVPQLYRVGRVGLEPTTGRL
jgi:hypothetical protein